MLATLAFVLLTATGRAYAFPAALMLSDDAALDLVLANIPFFSVGLLAFGVFTFFMVMRRINRVTIYAHLAVFTAFLGSIFDLSHIIQRGGLTATHILNGQHPIDALTVVRELSFAASIGLRFFFYWAFVAEPPRGELPPLPIPDDRRPNFITLDSDSTLHSASWSRWSILGFLLKWGLLFMTIGITVLQALWRIVPHFRRFGTVYNVEGTLQIVVSSLLILKLLANTYLSPLMPRWKTFRDYSPILLALAISMGLGIGNILCFEFSESTLGRFLQAVELYSLILFVLISAFYKMPVRASVVAELVRRRLGGPDAFDGGMRSAKAASPANALADMASAGLPSGGVEDRRRSVPAEGPRPRLSQRFSTTSKLSSWLVPRRNIERGSTEGDGNRLWNQDEAERGQSTAAGSQRASLEQQTPTGPNESAGWKDAVFTSVMDEKDVRSKPARVPPPIVIPTISDRRFTLPGTESTDQTARPPSSVYTTSRLQVPHIKRPRPVSQDSSVSPVYGLNGVVQTLKPMDPRALRRASDSSAGRSPGMDSLIRQQKELEKSIADLRLFSPLSNVRQSRIQSSMSDFSLSNFPDPPFFAKSSNPSTPSTPKLDSLIQSRPRDTTAQTNERGESFVVDDLAFQMVPPQMPAAKADSAMVKPGDGDDSVLTAREARFDSQGTQYDVTSFIKGLSTPPEESNRRQPAPADLEGGDRGAESDDEGIGPATIAALTRGRLQVVDTRTLPEFEFESVRSGKPATVMPAEPVPASVTAARVPPPAAAAAPTRMVPSIPPQPRVPPPTFRPSAPAPPTDERPASVAKPRGLPSRRLLEISNPIPRSGKPLDERVAFERPRPAPLVLQGANDREAVSPMTANGDKSFF